MSAGVDATQGPLLKTSLRLAWPAVAQALLLNAYAFNDFYFVARQSDRDATAALSACFALVIVINMALSVFPVGAMTMMAQRFGARDRVKLASLGRQALVVSTLWSLGLSAWALAFMPAIAASMNAAPAVTAHIITYMSAIGAGLVLFGWMRVATSTFYACGDTRTPLKLELASLALNTALNAWLVPTHGVLGAALATVASRALPGIVGLALIKRGALGFALHSQALQDWRPRRQDLGQMWRIGAYESLSGALYGIIFLMLNRMAGQLGPAAQGGLGAGLRGIEWLGFAFGDGFLVASVASVAQNLGAKQPRRALRAAWLNGALSAACCQLVGVAFLLAPERLCSLVTQDPQTLAYAAQYVRTVGWVMGAVGLEMSMYGAILGVGATHITLLISGGLNVARVPLAAALLFGPAALLQGSLWAAFGLGQPPPVRGGFEALSWTIAVTAACKALLYALYISWRLPRADSLRSA